VTRVGLCPQSIHFPSFTLRKILPVADIQRLTQRPGGGRLNDVRHTASCRRDRCQRQLCRHRSFNSVMECCGRVSSEVLGSDFLTGPFYCFLSFVIAAPLALPWAVLAILLARSASIDSGYWITSGARAGLATVSLFIWWFHDELPSITDEGAEVPVFAQWLRIAPASTIAGALGGLVFKRIDARLN
jgi:hypothetical protein